MTIRKELEAIADLETGARVISSGADLYRQGEICSTYFVVLSGWIALSVLVDDGSCQILDFALPDALLGFQSASNAPIYHSARCLSTARVFGFPKHKLDDLIERNPRLAILLWRQVTANEARAHDHLANLGLRSARERIAHLLLEIYVRLRRRLPIEPGETIHLPLNLVHIGQAVGLTYVHVCRTLQILRRQKIVRFAHHNLEIINPAALIAAAGIELDLPDHQWHDGGRQLIPARSSLLHIGSTCSLPAGWMPVQSDRRVHAGPGSLSEARERAPARAA